MPRSFKVKFFVLVGWQILLLAALLVPKLVVLATGNTVILKTAPVDPRDLFRGDYVVLSYEISQLDLKRLPTKLPKPLLKRGDPVYVLLTPKTGEPQKPWKAAAVFGHKPSEDDLTGYGPDALFLRGTVVYHEQHRMQVEYGIESYFVPEGKGRELERVRGTALTVEVKVDSGGRGVIQRVLVDGEPVT